MKLDNAHFARKASTTDVVDELHNQSHMNPSILLLVRAHASTVAAQGQKWVLKCEQALKSFTYP